MGGRVGERFHPGGDFETVGFMGAVDLGFHVLEGQGGEDAGSVEGSGWVGGWVGGRRTRRFE